MGCTVELAGLPGAGKSTFARALVARAGFSLVRVVGKKEILWYNFLFLLRFPIRFFWLLVLVLTNLGPRILWYEKFVNLFLVHNAKYMKARTIDRAVIDQGHIQNVVSLFESEVCAKRISTFLARIPSVDHVVLFQTPKEVRAKRLIARGYGARESMGEQYLRRWESAYEANWNTINQADFDGRSVVHTIESDEHADTLVDEFMKRPEFYYILNARMPTERAYGNQTTLMCGEFARAGARVELWAPQRANPITESVFQFYGIEKNFSFRAITSHEFSFLKRYLKKLGFYCDAMAYIATLFTMRFPAQSIVYTRKPEIAWVMSTKNVRVVYECHEWYARFRSVQLWMIRRVSTLVVTNRYIKGEFVRAGIPDSRVLIAPNGVDLAMFSIDTTKEDAVGKIDLAKHIPNVLTKKVLLYTGSFTTMGEDKGISDILRALSALRSDDIIFLAVGGDAKDIARYETEARRVGVEKNAYFMGRVGKDELALYQRASDTLLMPFPRKAHYEYYMSPLKTFEYMASGRPIIASDLPSIREILSDEDAYLTKPDDSEDLAEKITAVLGDAIGSTAKAKHAREAVGRYSWKNRAKLILDFIEKK